MKKAIFTMFLLAMFSTTHAQLQNFTIIKKVIASSDDAEESEDGYDCYLGSSDLEMVYDNYDDLGNQTVGIRFTDIDIPTNATITNAYIQFTADETTSEQTSLMIKGEAVANSITFMDTENNVSSRTMTSAIAAWNFIPAWSSGQAGLDQQTPDLTTIVSEIITNNGWARGNPMTFIISGTGQRVADSYDGSSTTAPELIVEYSVYIYNDDLAVSNFTSPNSIIAPNSSVPITIEITNLGNNAQSNFDVSYSVNGATAVVETTTLTLALNESATYTFSQTVDMSALGIYSIETEAILANDEYTNNNTYTRTINVENASVENTNWGSTLDPLNGLSITWKSQGTNDQIKWGYTDEYSEGTFDASTTTWHDGSLFHYTFPQVTASSTIHYSVYNSSMGDWTSDKTFETSSSLDVTTFSFTVFGDSRTHLDDWQTVANATEETEFALFMGDVVNSGPNGNEWDDWCSYGENFVSDNLMFHTYGNHDWGGNYENLYTLPNNEFYYSFEYGNAIIICLDSEDAGSTAQYNWLQTTLNDNADKTWKFVFFHVPFFTSGEHENEMNSYFNTWWQEFDNHGVDMIFNGHTHGYQRTKPINRNVSTTNSVAEYGSSSEQGRCQIVSGGAGAPLMPPTLTNWLEVAESIHHYCTIDITENELVFKAKDVNNVVFDEITLTKDGNTINSVKKNEIDVFPNPSNGNFTINFDDITETSTIKLYDVVGKLVFTTKSKTNKSVINIPNLENGMYFIKITTNNNILTKSIIIKK